MEVGVAGQEEGLVEELLVEETRVGARKIIGVQKKGGKGEMGA
jgi:hypothetical protein